MPADEVRLMCRLCMECSDDDFTDIFDGNGTDGLLVWKVIKDLLQIDVSEDDGMPPIICKECTRKLEYFKEFKKTCTRSKEAMQKVITWMKTHPMEMDICNVTLSEDCDARDERHSLTSMDKLDTPYNSHEMCNAASSEEFAVNDEQHSLTWIDELDTPYNSHEVEPNRSEETSILGSNNVVISDTLPKKDRVTLRQGRTKMELKSDTRLCRLCDRFLPTSRGLTTHLVRKHRSIGMLNGAGRAPSSVDIQLPNSASDMVNSSAMSEKHDLLEADKSKLESCHHQDKSLDNLTLEVYSADDFRRKIVRRFMRREEPWNGEFEENHDDGGERTSYPLHLRRN